MKAIQSLGNWLFGTIFWGWNLIFLATVYCGILPIIGIGLLLATVQGDIPVDFCLTFLTLIAVPIFCSIYGFRYFRNEPKELMRWFYGVEAPLVTWCLVRLFLIRELTLASSLMLGTLLVCIVAFAVEVLQGYRANRKVFSVLQMIAHTLMLFMGIYLGVVLLFYVLPVAAWILKGFFGLAIAFLKFGWVEEFWRNITNGGFIGGIFVIFHPLSLLFILLFGFTTTLFVGMPFVLTNLYIDSGKKIFKAFAEQHTKNKAYQVSAAVIAVWLLAFSLFNQQPQTEAFNLLEQNPQNRPELLASATKIRRGLVNANLYPYRYLSTKEGNDHIENMYEDIGIPKPIAEFFQQRYNQLLSPFLYRGSRGDVAKSAQLYADFFDTPIQKAERKSVRHAIQSTAIVDQAKAGLLNIDQKKVWLAKQEVKIAPHGDWANVEIHEVYENQTTDVEEILYYFSLPESAAITGLWLGESDDLDQRFAYQVSPRGAAQAVYNSQVRRTRPVDPALLEQVGPGQYRLRAFPVPPKRNTSRNGVKFETPQMHLWLTYQVMQQEQGWAMPKLAEKRNIFWTGRTKRIRDGKAKRLFGDKWLEDFARQSSQSDRQAFQLNLADGYAISAQPLLDQDYSLPNNKKYALILDTSYSMRNQLAKVQETWKWLKSELKNNDLDLYITDDLPEKAQRLDSFVDLSPQDFFGSLQTDGMLQQFEQLRKGKNYDAVLLLTDEGSYELSKDKPEIPELNSPLWMVHLGGELPRAYEDRTLEIMQNRNGGVAQNVATVMKRLATEAANSATVVDGYKWTVNSTELSKTDNGLEPLAARQLISKLTQKGKNNLSLAELDAIHQVAKNHDIVTPYSSMIVLVNDQQREQLKAAEAASDRFDREVENGVEQLEQPFNPFESATVSGVPEPDFWILLVIVGLGLLIVLHKQRKRSINWDKNQAL